MIWSMMYRAHLPERIDNVGGDVYAPLRASTDLSYSYRAFARGQVLIPNRGAVSGHFTFEYDITPYIEKAENEFLPFLKERLTEIDFGIKPRLYKIFFTKPIALYSSGWFLKGIHKLPGYQGIDVCHSTVPFEDEGKPWWGYYYEPNLKELYNPPTEHAFGEDMRSYIYTGNPKDPRVCCPALIPSYVWDRLRFFFRFFDTVYILKPTEYARRQYYRFVEEDFPAIMRVLQGLSWLEPVDLPSDVIGTPIEDTHIWLSLSLGESYYSAWRDTGSESEWVAGSEIIPAPSYLPEALQTGKQIEHLNSGKWKFSPDSGYWPAPPQPTWWDIANFSTQITGMSLLHLLSYFNYPWDEEGAWVNDILTTGAQDKVFASYTTGYYDSQGNWIMPAFVSSVSPLLIVSSTSGDLIILSLEAEDVEAEHITKVFKRGEYRVTGRLGALEYKVRTLLTTRVNITISGTKILSQNAKGYAPPDPQKIAKVFYPYFELESYFTYPRGHFLKKEKRQLQFKPSDANRFTQLTPPKKITTEGGTEKLNGITFHVATLPTGESSNVSAWLEDVPLNPLTDNLSVELPETVVGDSVRPWLESHFSPALGYAVGKIKRILEQRRYNHTRMISDDITVHQVKMLRGAPNPNFPITITSEKEAISASDYLRKVGIDLTLLPQELHGKFIWFYRMLARSWFPYYSAEPTEIRSFSQWWSQIKASGKHVADYPLESSPKTVLFHAPAISPPELQFIAQFLYVVSPAFALAWEWRYKEDNYVLMKHLRPWGLLQDESGDEDVWAQLLSAITLRNYAQCDFAHFKYDAYNDVFYITPYTQPIITSALVSTHRTKTGSEYQQVSPNMLSVVQSAPVEYQPATNLTINIQAQTQYDYLSSVVWSTFLNGVAYVNLKDSDDENVIEYLKAYIALHLPPPRPEWGIDSYKWAEQIIKRMFIQPMPLAAPHLVDEINRYVPNLIGWRAAYLAYEGDFAAEKLTPSTPTRNTNIIIVDAADGGAVHVPSGIAVARIQTKYDESTPLRNKLQVKLDDVAKTEILIVKEGFWAASLVDITSIAYFSRLSLSRQRAGLIITVGRDGNTNCNTRDYYTSAYALSSALTYAPFLFSDVPKARPEEIMLFYPLDAWDVLTKPGYATTSILLRYGVSNFPAGEKRIKFGDFINEKWVFKIQQSPLGDALIGYPIPPHQRSGCKIGGKDTKVVPLPVGEFALQVLPLWAIRCSNIPPEGALFSYKSAANLGELYEYLPQVTINIYPKVCVANEEIRQRFRGRVIPDRIVVEKGKFDTKIVMKMPDDSDVVVYSPDEVDDEHWVELLCGAQGYLVPTYPYSPTTNTLTDSPKWETGSPYINGRAAFMNFKAQEDMWFDGYLDERNETKLRLNPLHPYHWRVYMNITVPHPILPKVYAIASGERVSFLHLDEEPLMMFGLIRCAPFQSAEAFWHNARNKDERPEKLINTWRAKLKQLNPNFDFPTLYWLEQSEEKVIEGLSGIKSMLQKGAKSEYFANADESKLFNDIVDYLTEDYTRLDYSFFAAYYAPTNLMDDVKVKNWFEGAPLPLWERTPACLLVAPVPHKELNFSNVLVYADENATISTQGIFITAPALPLGRALHEQDILTNYPLLQEHAETIQRRVEDTNYPRMLFHTFMPSDWELNILKMLYPHIYGDYIEKIQKMKKYLVLSPLTQSAFIYPFYPSQFEVVNALKDALALGMWRASNVTYRSRVDRMYMGYDTYAPVSLYPYPILLEAALAYHRARRRTANINAAYRRLCIPSIDFRFSPYNVFPFHPSYFFQQGLSGGNTEEHFGQTVTRRAFIIDDYVNNNFSYQNELTQDALLDYIIGIPLGGYPTTCSFPSPYNILQPFVSYLFIQPYFYFGWFPPQSRDFGATKKPTPWGVQVKLNLEGSPIVDTTYLFANEYIAIPFPGGALPLHLIAFKGLLQEAGKANILSRFVSEAWLPILYDGGFVWLPSKYLFVANQGGALIQAEKLLLTTQSPVFYKQDELEKKGIVFKKDEGEEEGGSGGGYGVPMRAERKWVFQSPEGFSLLWFTFELPSFTHSSLYYPFNIATLHAARPNLIQSLNPNNFEKLFRICPQKELKLMLTKQNYFRLFQGINFLPQLRHPLTGWLVNGYKLIQHISSTFPPDLGYPQYIEEFANHAKLDITSDPHLLELYYSIYANHWLLGLLMLLQLAPTAAS